jgi:phosphohistidine phosphatase
MRRLMLLRHAKTAQAIAGGSDRERILTERGRHDAPLIGAYMARNALVPDRIVCSTATRTRETFDLLVRAMRVKLDAVYDEQLYGADPDTIFDIVQATPDGVHTLLLVGHNPGLHMAGLDLIASGDVETRERLNEKLPTSGLIVIDVPFDDWSKLHPHAGRLDRFITPAVLSAQTD